MRKPPLVATSTRLRRAPRALTRISSARPCEYTSAGSNMFTPASSAISMRLVASATSVAPQARYTSLLPPKVAVPKLRADTRKSDPPIRRNSIADILSFAQIDACTVIRAGAGLRKLFITTLAAESRSLPARKTQRRQLLRGKIDERAHRRYQPAPRCVDVIKLGPRQSPRRQRDLQ